MHSDRPLGAFGYTVENPPREVPFYAFSNASLVLFRFRKYFTQRPLSTGTLDWKIFKNGGMAL